MTQAIVGRLGADEGRHWLQATTQHTGPSGPSAAQPPSGGAVRAPGPPTPAAGRAIGSLPGTRERETTTSGTPDPCRGTPLALPSHVPEHRDRPDAQKGEDWAK